MKVSETPWGLSPTTIIAVEPDSNRKENGFTEQEDTYLNDCLEDKVDSLLLELSEVCLDEDEILNEYYWNTLCDEDYEYLTGVRSLPQRCTWCGGHYFHSPLCDQMRSSWEPTMSFGKYKGKSISDIPKEYLKWILKNTNALQDDLRCYLHDYLKKE